MGSAATPEAKSGPASGSLRSALRHKGFGRFLTATVISSAGDFLNSVGLVVVIYRLTGSAAWLGAAAFFRVMAWAGATAAGGVVGDRFDRRQVLVSLNVAAGLVTLVLAVSASLEASVVVIVLLASVIDLASGLVNPSFSAAVPAVVGEDDVAAANAAVTTVEQVSVVAGPALGAVLVAVFSPALAFACNGVSFLLAAALFAGVAAGGNVAEGDDEPPARFRDGVAAVRDSRPARVLLGVFMAAVFSFGFTMVLFVLVAVERLGLAESGVGYLRMAEGVGGVAAAVVAGRLAARSSALVLVGAGLVTGLSLAALALVDQLVPALMVLGVGGGAYVVLEVVVVTWLQRVTPDEMLGRIMGLLMSLGALATAAGALLAPILENAIGLPWTLAVAGLVLVGAVALAGPALPSVARVVASRGEELAPFVAELRGVSVFTAADDLALEQLAAAVSEVEVSAGQTVLREGDPADDFYVVRTGRFDVLAIGEAGGPSRLVNTMGPHDWFGEIGLLEQRPRTATVTATEAAALWRIPGEAFRAALETPALRPDVLRNGVTVRLARTHPTLASAPE